MNRRGFIRAILVISVIPIVVCKKKLPKGYLVVVNDIKIKAELRKALNAANGVGLIPEKLDRDLREVTFTKKHLQGLDALVKSKGKIYDLTGRNNNGRHKKSNR